MAAARAPGVSDGAGGGVGIDFGGELRHWAGLHQRGADGVAHEIMHHALLAETHLGFRRMHVHIHFAAGQFQKQQHHRENGRRQMLR